MRGRDRGSTGRLSDRQTGVAPENLQLTTDNGVLTVSGEKRELRKDGEQHQYHLVERSYGNFSRSFRMPKNLDESKIEATFDHGVLTIHIPKAALPQPRKIEVRSGGTAVSGDGSKVSERWLPKSVSDKRQAASGRR
jgi:Molecular chaperone (small heat shock protein)